MRNTKGITLIALIITIIILLILAGISIATLTGENGILNKASKAEEETIKAQIKEEIEMAIMEIQIDQIEKGNKVTLETLGNEESGELIKKLNEITIELNNNEIIGEYKGYEYTIDDKFNVTIGSQVRGIHINYELSTQEYTNQNIIVTIYASSDRGEITSIEAPTSLTENADKTYTITKNGKYEFTVTDSLGQIKTRTIDIQKIDKVAPKCMEPTISDVTENGFTIFANVEDEEATNENAKSGIEKCEYYINGVKYESSETKYTIDTLEPNTEYSIYIIAYDKAGNNSEQSTQITQRTKDEYVDFETYINSHMQVDKKIYISSEYGNDITGNGTQDNPYLTLDKIKEAGIIENGYSYAIVLMNGEYTLTTKIFDLNCNKNINIIGNRRRTILNVGSMFNNSGKGTANYSINFYRLIWNFVQRSTQGLNCKTTTTYHNVAFVNNVNDDNWGFFTSFYNNILEFENCTSIGKYGEGLRANEGGAKVTNCYGKFSVHGANNLKIDENTNYITNEPKVDNSTYQITDSENLWKNKGIGTNPDGSQANFGVYGGEYSWEE